MLKSIVLSVAFALTAVPAAAEVLGWSFAGSNDSLGDQHDRWQSNSAQLSIATGPEWTGQAPADFGKILEWKLRSDILTPAHLTAPVITDRRHAAFFALGVNSYASRGETDMRIGGDLFVIGPQTGLLQFQRNLHKILGFPIPTLDDFQIDNAIRAQISGEVLHTFQAGHAEVSPFVEAQIGPEDLIRAGVDVSFGGLGGDDLMTRLPVTGHRIPLIRQGSDGFSFVLGGDVAFVEDSLFLPESLGHELVEVRTRLRAGVHYERDRFDLFYGLSWLGREFEAQPEGQLVGALHLGLRF